MGGCGSSPKEDENGSLSGAICKPDASMADMHLIRIFEDRLKQGKIQNKKTAIHFGDSTLLSYAELNTFASCLARNIIDRLGYDYKLTSDKDLIVAVCLPMSEKAIACILAVLKTGAAYLPLDPQYPEDLLLSILSSLKPALLITDDNGHIFNKYDFESFSNIVPVVSLGELWLDIEFTREPTTKRPSIVLPWDIDFLETSAGTGEHPIAIMHCQGLQCTNQVGVRLGTRSILNLVQYHWKKFKMTEKDSCCLTVSIASPISIPQMFIPLLLGCTLHLFRRFDLNDMQSFLKNVSWRKLTRLSFPTHHLEPFLDSIDFSRETMLKSIKSLKYVICRGSMIPHDLVQRFFEIFKSGVCLSNCCGSVQTTGEIAFEIYESLANYESKIVSERSTFGIIVDNVKIYVVDENMNLVPKGSKGEICVSGDCLAMGYVGEGPKGGPAEKYQFISNPFNDQKPLYEKLYRTGEYGSIVEGQRRLFLDVSQDLQATQNDDDTDLQMQRKW